MGGDTVTDSTDQQTTAMTGADIARLERLADIHEIVQVLYRYCAAVDRLDADRLATCFHTDGTDDHGIFEGPASEFVPWVMGFVGAWVSTQHDISNPIVEIDPDDPDRAVSECHWTGYYRMPAPAVSAAHDDRDGVSTPGTAGAGAQPVVDQLAVGRYLDRFERRDGVWRIAHRTCVTDFTHDLGEAPAPRLHRLAGRRDRRDLSFHLRELALGFRLPTS